MLTTMRYALIALLLSACSSSPTAEAPDLSHDAETGRDAAIDALPDMTPHADAAQVDGAGVDMGRAADMERADLEPGPDLAPVCLPAQSQCASASDKCCGPYACAFGIGGNPVYICCAGPGADCNENKDCCAVAGHTAICINNKCTHN